MCIKYLETTYSENQSIMLIFADQIFFCQPIFQLCFEHNSIILTSFIQKKLTKPRPNAKMSHKNYMRHVFFNWVKTLQKRARFC